MRRRTAYDPLQPVGHPVWLVVRDPLQRALAATELPPGADLSAALKATMETLRGAGWKPDAESLKWGLFFCRKGQARLGVTLEVRDPGSAPSLKEWPARNP